MLPGLRTVVFMVADLTAAKAWYAEVAGHPPYFDTDFYVGFEVGGYELGLHPGEPGVDGDLAYWGVDDADAAFARLLALGATALQPVTDVGGGIRLGSVRDPFGNALGVIQNPHFRPEVADAGPLGPVAVIPRGTRIAAVPGDVSDAAIVHERVYPVSPARMWDLWTTADGVKTWLAPDARIDLRVGGPFEILFDTDQPVGKRGSEDCKVLAWLPERMLAITWNAPPHLAAARTQFTQVVIELTPIESGTRLRVTHHGWPASGLGGRLAGEGRDRSLVWARPRHFVPRSVPSGLALCARSPAATRLAAALQAPRARRGPPYAACPVTAATPINPAVHACPIAHTAVRVGPNPHR